ncbi:MAG: hypothetical protein OEY65_03830, partial [Gammaproteobacteria bacterium]|nr:hypothetical protein [Gammaproteobacteria bacterium]
AIPYTLEQMGENKLALQHYTYAIENYNKELSSLESVLSSIKTGELLFALSPVMVTENVLATEYKPQIHASISIPYLHHILNNIDFQKTHKIYLDLIYLRKSLIEWKNQFPAYYLMLKERSTYYSKQQHSVSNHSQINLVNALKIKRDKLAFKVQQIEQQNDIYALASEEEKEVLNSLNTIKKSLVRLSKKDDFRDENEKYNLLRGLLLWDISTDYSPRFWKIKNELNQLDKALDISVKYLDSLKLSRKNAPLAFSGYEKRIIAKEKAVDRLLNKTTDTIRLQEKLIEKQASALLQQRHHQIKNYYIRASYSLARLHDLMTLPSGSNTTSGIEITKKYNVNTPLKSDAEK